MGRNLLVGQAQLRGKNAVQVVTQASASQAGSSETSRGQARAVLNLLVQDIGEDITRDAVDKMGVS